MTENVRLRILHGMEEFAEVVALQERIWGMARQDTVSPYIMNAMDHNGASIIAAEIDTRMVGFCLGFAGKREGSIHLWSHMAGVLPEYQGHKIGYMLKQEQRRWALANGYERICWTFDPLQRGNANFNFRHLGVRANTYHVNLYGEMTDAINAGLSSDRLEAEWQLNDAHVIALAEGASPQNPSNTFTEECFLVRVSDQISIQNMDAPFVLDSYCIEIPYSIGVLKKSDKAKAIAWQVAVRQAMLNAFEQGYVACDFVVRDDRCWYVVRRKNVKGEFIETDNH